MAKAQGELNAYRRKVGLRELRQDGLYGPKTTQAVKDFQEKYGLEQTGKYDAQTKEALARRLSPQAAAKEALGPGAHGPEVRELQADIAKHGVKVGQDVVYGRQTRKALAEFQRRNGLEPTGLMDAKTRAALDAPPKSSFTQALDKLKGYSRFDTGPEGEPRVIHDTSLAKGTPSNGRLVNGIKIMGIHPPTRV
ncbi:MAG: peptidoglycan-binding protein [Elusimicrobia bacterium]|nr:peptidoglycan-binding protein [Elusimicrobiota bacterium]